MCHIADQFTSAVTKLEMSHLAPS